MRRNFPTTWRAGRALAVAGALLFAAVGIRAQAPADTAAEIQQLKADLARIEARLAALESATRSAAAPAAVSTTAPPPGEGIDHAGMPGMAHMHDEAAAKPVGQEPVGQDSMDHGPAIDIDVPHIPQMSIRGFGDVRAALADQNLAVIYSNPGAPTASWQGGNSTFALGIMDLFIASKISKNFSYLSEIGFEADPATNGVGVDLERAQITYLPNENFSITAGRTHAMFGYYNTAFHHGTWFQTAIDRPRFLQFEDSGGPLPIHNVGLTAVGKLPGALGLHLFGEVGNGRQTTSLFAGTTPANVLADHTGKSTNIGAYLRPDRFSGLQLGFNWYQAALVPTQVPGAASHYQQNIYMAHLVYITPKLEFLAEGGEIGDKARGSDTVQYTSGGYAQLSRQFHQVRPYFRYQWLNPNFSDPNQAWAGRWVGPDPGLRWDVNTFVALKAEYEHYDWRGFTIDSTGAQVLPLLHKQINQVTAQITYTF